MLTLTIDTNAKVWSPHGRPFGWFTGWVTLQHGQVLPCSPSLCCFCLSYHLRMRKSIMKGLKSYRFVRMIDSSFCHLGWYWSSIFNLMLTKINLFNLMYWSSIKIKRATCIPVYVIDATTNDTEMLHSKALLNNKFIVTSFSI